MTYQIVDADKPNRRFILCSDHMDQYETRRLLPDDYCVSESDDDCEACTYDTMNNMSNF